MTYELAKKLQEAGFPIVEKADRLPPDQTYLTKNLEYAYAPTLSELIEACGLGFYQLTSHLNQKWTAQHEDKREYEGSTPEEAVAKLWLSLNAKDDQRTIHQT